jgi:hypothetical protein
MTMIPHNRQNPQATYDPAYPFSIPGTFSNDAAKHNVYTIGASKIIPFLLSTIHPLSNLVR